MNEYLKGLKEDRADLVAKMEGIHSKGQLSQADQRDFSKLASQIEEVDKQLRAEEKNEEVRKKSADRAFDGGLPDGGTPVNGDEKSRVYAPDQSISTDNHPDHRELGLGAYLRAVIDKPRNSVERMAVQNSVTSTGYELPTTVAAQLIDQARAENPVISAGARTITLGDGEKTKFVRIDSDPNTVWHAELEEEQTDSPTFGAVEFKSKTLLALTEISRELLQDSANIDEALATAFTGAINNAMLTATFSGSGGNEPTGLKDQVTQTQPYTDIGFADFVKANKTLHDSKTPVGERSHIMAPDIWESLNLLEDSTGQPIRKPFGLLDIPEYTNAGVPAGVGYAGDFSNVVYGMRLNMTLEQHPSYSAKKYGSLWVAAMRFDMAVFRPSQLVRIEPDA